MPGDSRTGDYYGHGTHVAGILAGDGGKSTGLFYSRTFLGVAPETRLVNLRVLDSEGKSSDSAVIAAISRAIELKNRFDIRVINLSLGRPIFESYEKDPLCQAVEKAWKAGIVVVVAAGNEGRNNAYGTSGYGMIMSPANDPYVITVGAMRDMSTVNRSDDQIATYSSKGPAIIDHVVKPDLVAPGNQVISLASNGKLSALSSLAMNQIPVGLLRQGRQPFFAFNRLLQAERYQHGGPDGKRRGRDSARQTSGTYSRSGESHPDEDGHEDISVVEHRV